MLNFASIGDVNIDDPRNQISERPSRFSKDNKPRRVDVAPDEDLVNSPIAFDNNSDKSKTVTIEKIDSIDAKPDLHTSQLNADVMAVDVDDLPVDSGRFLKNTIDSEILEMDLAQVARSLGM